VNKVHGYQMHVSPAHEAARAWFGRYQSYGGLPRNVAMCGAWHHVTRHYG
jgi:hypothetical protein